MATAEESSRFGRYVTKRYQGEAVRAFVPPPLPPAPPVDLSRLQILLEQANQAIGRLDGVASLLPDLSLLLYTYVRKEAVLSSQIEGTPALVLEGKDIFRGLEPPQMIEALNQVIAKVRRESGK